MGVLTIIFIILLIGDFAFSLNTIRRREWRLLAISTIIGIVLAILILQHA
jgi:hypothetical protein